MTKADKVTLKSIVQSMTKQYGEGKVMMMGDNPLQNVEVISSGSLAVDLALGVGGIPRGRVIELFGQQSGGKSTLAQHMIAEAQKAGHRAAYIDAENCLDIDYAARLGVNVDELILVQPESGEEALNITLDLVETGELALIVVDSVAALIPKAELEGDIGDQTVGLQARMMGQALRKLSGPAAKNQTAVIFINQTRALIGGPAWGAKETTPGGAALKFFASVRMEIKRIKDLKDEAGAIYGVISQVKIVKSKVAPPRHEVEVNIIFGQGIDLAPDTFNTALALGLIVEKSKKYFYGELELGFGKQGACDGLCKNLPQITEIRKAIAATIQERRNAPPATGGNS